MQLDNPIFNAAEVAEIIDVKPSAIRDWRDRGLSLFIGTKVDHLVEYTVREAAVAAITRDLIHLNFPLRMAAQAACALLEVNPEPEVVFRGGPEEIALLTPSAGTGFVVHREMLRAPEVHCASIVLKVGDIWARTLQRAEAVYKRQSAAA